MVNKKRESIVVDTKAFRFELKEHTPFTDLVLDMTSDWLKHKAKDGKESVKTPVEIDMQEIEEPVVKPEPEPSEPVVESEQEAKPLLVELPADELPDDVKPHAAWREWEDEILTKYYPEMTASAIKLEKLPHRSEQAISDRAYYLLHVQKVKQRAKEKKLKKETEVEPAVIPSVKPEPEAKPEPVEPLEPVVEPPADEPEPYDTWKKWEDEILTKYYPVMTVPAIKMEKLPHRSEQAIYDRACFLKVQKVKRTKAGKKLTAVMDKLRCYGTTSIWKPVLDFILGVVGDEEFTIKDVSGCVAGYYKKVLKRGIVEASQDAYASCYVRYMKEEGLVERCDDPNVSPVMIYRKVKKKSYAEPPSKKVEERVPPKVEEEIPEKPVVEPEVIPSVKPEPEAKPEPVEPEKPVELSGVAKSIYNLVEDGRIKVGNKVSVEDIKRQLQLKYSSLKFSSDELKDGLAVLIQKGKAWQSAPGEVSFK